MPASCHDQTNDTVEHAGLSHAPVVHAAVGHVVRPDVVGHATDAHWVHTAVGSDASGVHAAAGRAGCADD